MKKIILYMVVLLSLIYSAGAELVLDNIQFDPAVISAGDEVDIVVQYHAEYSQSIAGRLGNPDYRFIVELEPDDTLTREYVLIEDATGDNLHGVVFGNDLYNVKYRVRVSPSAPQGNYEFRLSGWWEYKGERLEGEEFIKFVMQVKKEGVILDVSSLTSDPAIVRPGDDGVSLFLSVDNAGHTIAKSIEVQLNEAKGIKPSFADNNQKYLGLLSAGESKNVQFSVDVTDDTPPGKYDLSVRIFYRDEDDNEFTVFRTVAMRVDTKPILHVTGTRSSIQQGGSGVIEIDLINDGFERAEAVDVRILKDALQPFETSIRSAYVGDVEPNQTVTVSFPITVDKDANPQNYSLSLLLRARGDSDAGNNNIYTFRRSAQIIVTPADSSTKWYYLFIALLTILAAIAVWRYKK